MKVFLIDALTVALWCFGLPFVFMMLWFGATENFTTFVVVCVVAGLLLTGTQRLGDYLQSLTYPKRNQS